MVVRDAMIVAGGQGTRLLPLTATTPKPLLPFCGEPFLAGVVRRLAAAGVERVFLVVGATTEPFEVLRPVADAVGVTLTMVAEPEPLDTAGGVRSAVELVSGAFLVLNGDILTDVDLRAVVDAHQRSGAAATIVLTRVEDTATFGVCVRDGTRIVAFVEKPSPGSLPGQDCVNAGTYVLEPDVLAAFPDGSLSFERQVFPRVLDAGLHIEGYVWDGVWADLGTPERYLDGHRLALSGELSWPSLDAVPERAPGIRVAATAEVADDATLVPPVVVLDDARVAFAAIVGPDTVIGRAGAIGQDAVVARSVLFAGATVAANAHVDGVIAGTGATVGSGTAPGTVIADAASSDQV